MAQGDADELVADTGHSEADSSKVTKESQVENFPETVHVLTEDNGFKGTLYLVGTAHFSLESQEEVRDVIRKTRPNAVFVELCESRIAVLSMNEETLLEQAKTLTFEKMLENIKEHGAVRGLLNILLLQASASITKQLGMAPGGEFRVAVKEAKNVPGCRIILGDRPINITLQRAWSSLSLYNKIRLSFALMSSSRQNITPEEVEQCKKRDILEELLARLAGDFPTLTHVLVTERDQYMASVLKQLLHSLADPKRCHEVTDDGRSECSCCAAVGDGESEPGLFVCFVCFVCNCSTASLIRSAATKSMTILGVSARAARPLEMARVSLVCFFVLFVLFATALLPR